MSIFNIITLLGGLAMFLYGMRMMGDGLKESSSGPLKKALEKLTNTAWKAFLLGLLTTAVIQSSTATIVITAGLVSAGLISLHQSLGIIIGANVGTTVTGQIIRLLDINDGSTSFLQFFKPSTLAPVALIAGILLIMAFKFKSSDKIGRVLIGFGILFTGLMNMTDAVGSLTESGVVERLFSSLGDNPVIGYIIGAGVAFVLQSSSASIGILQAFSTSGQLTFSAIYAVLVGIYLGDCVTTAIVINIGAKPEAKRVGYVNILFNLAKSALIFIAVTILYQTGVLNGIWRETITSGGIANTNSLFNIACAVLLFPAIGLLEKLSYRLVPGGKKDSEPDDRKQLEDALNPVFFGAPAIAFARCFDIMLEMYKMARTNIGRSFELLVSYDLDTIDRISTDEDRIDSWTDKVCNYLVQMSGHITDPAQAEILNYYASVVTEFERLGDHAMNIAECAADMKEQNVGFSIEALEELKLVEDLLDQIFVYAQEAFEKNSLESAWHIEPLEEVVDDMVRAMKDNHLDRLKDGACDMIAGTAFLNLLSDVERISDICSNIGVATVSRIKPEIKHQVHDYVAVLHSGSNEEFNREYREAREKYYSKLQ